ncbi:hypothetical protein TNCT_339711 [Trichonephila clavata]|uniref:Uncharacterized protein n=1 Tax=Trichonephila clavata TaxID=2740835 RepID=A0A8X6FF73_TRICU|nr:hypothetical protein TNCT_339711 [Trichonephila clavata]
MLLSLPFDSLLFSPFPLHSFRLNSSLPPSSKRCFHLKKESLETFLSPMILLASLCVASPGTAQAFAWGRPDGPSLPSFQSPGAMTPLPFTYGNHCKIGNASRFTVITIGSIQSVE